MAVNFTFGEPGTGKTYRHVLQLIKTFGDDNEPIIREIKKKLNKSFLLKSTSCFTNINELDVTMFNDVEFMDFDNILIHIEDLYFYYHGKSSKPRSYLITDDEKIAEIEKKDSFIIRRLEDENRLIVISTMELEDATQDLLELKEKISNTTNEKKLKSLNLELNYFAKQEVKLKSIIYRANQNIETLNKGRYVKPSDAQLLPYADFVGLAYKLFIIDEAKDYFGEKHKALDWWLSYHRHMKQDIILLTQNAGQIDLVYKGHTKIWWKAIASDFKINPNVMKYKTYQTSRLAKTGYVSTKNVPLIEDVFDLYGSGANETSKSLVLPFLLTAAALIVSIIIFLTFFYGVDHAAAVDPQIAAATIQKIDPNTPGAATPQSQQTKALELKDLEDKNKSNIKEKKLISIYCIEYDCFYKNFIVPKTLIFSKEYKNNIISSSKISSTTVQHYVLLDLEFYNTIFFKQYDRKVGKFYISKDKPNQRKRNEKDNLSRSTFK